MRESDIMAHGDDEDNGGVVSNFNVEREEDDLDGDGDGDSDEDGLTMLTAAFAKPSSKAKKNEKRKTITHSTVRGTATREWVGVVRSAGVSQQRDDDEMSQTSTGTGFSTVSCKHTKHSWEQAQK